MGKKNQIIYKEFLKSKNIYNLNKGYWTRMLKNKLELKFDAESKSYNLNKELHYDGNPIFVYIDKNLNRSIRILQDEFEIEKDKELKPMEIWWNNNENEYSANKSNELVIALFLFSDTVDLTIEICRLWLKMTETQYFIQNKFDSEIKSITMNNIT